MAEAKSLLSLIARGYAAGREDAATEALCFILSRSESARDEFAKFLGDDGEPLPVASFRTQQLVNGAFPDMACFDDDSNHVAFVESKFWASLTSRQPVNYWEALPDHRSATLLILAPASRVAGRDEGSLWDMLKQRLRRAHHDLSPVDSQERKDLVAATSEDGQRRLMLTSWDVLLDRLAEATKEDEDHQACFEVAELWGLAHDAIKDDDPVEDANLRKLIADAVARVKESGWANTDGLRTGGTVGGHYARFFRLGGRITGLRIDYKAKKQMDKPLWLWFWDSPDTRSSVSLDDVRDRLGASAGPGLEWLPNDDVCVPIDLPAGLGRKAMLDAIVAELERVAKTIDPYVPTYHREQTTG
ncbi:MAG: hypothetical protein OXP73_11300 [Chloroflexota bacterium]|nr:hypothetical protein [Chloroflexota bacterium]